MAHGEKSLGYLLVGSGSSREAKARYDSHGVDGHKEAKAFVPPQTVTPSDVCVAGQPSTTSSLCVPNWHGRAVQGFVRTSLSLHRLRQVQGYLLDEIEMVAHRAVELRAVGQSREDITQMAHRVAVEIPLACETAPAGEDGQGHHLAWAQGRLRSRTGMLSLGLRLAEIVHHDVKYGEEGVSTSTMNRFLSFVDWY